VLLTAVKTDGSVRSGLDVVRRPAIDRAQTEDERLSTGLANSKGKDKARLLRATQSRD